MWRRASRRKDDEQGWCEARSNEWHVHGDPAEHDVYQSSRSIICLRSFVSSHKMARLENSKLNKRYPQKETKYIRSVALFSRSSDFPSSLRFSSESIKIEDIYRVVSEQYRTEEKSVCHLLWICKQKGERTRCSQSRQRSEW